MAEICLVLHIKDFTGRRLEQIEGLFDGAYFPYVLYDHEVRFSTLVNADTVKNPYARGSITNISVYFVGELPVEIDVENNCIYTDRGSSSIYVDGSLADGPEYRPKYDCIDEDFEAQLELFCLSMFQSIILTAPDIDINTAKFSILLNQSFFKEKKYIEYPVHEESYERWPHMFKTVISIEQTWNWLTRNGLKYSSKPICPAVSLLYYLFNRQNHEVILYSVIGLETLYLGRKNRSGKKYMLKNRINTVFPDVPKDQIGRMYEVRSSISHGEGDISSSIVWMDLVNNNEEYEELALLSGAILIESIRMLIANNATSFTFEERVDVKYGFR